MPSQAPLYSTPLTLLGAGSLSIRKKLIEVALPLEAINRESAREKSIRHGHPSTLHLWWARRPLAACRAVLFASLVDDPSSRPEEFPTEEAQGAERRRLFDMIEELVKWENTTNERVLEAARAEILKSTGGNPPPVLDPFCGGGSIPLEAQRLGLEAHASDLNPVPVLINKALIEIPPKFAGMPPVNPESRKNLGHSSKWKGAAGLAEDVRYYGRWMRNEAERRIGHLYPKVRLPKEYGGGESTVIAWLWARTVTCPNPACGAQMPLVRTYALSTKKGQEAWLQPVIDRTNYPPLIRFEVVSRPGPLCEPAKVGRGASFRCLACSQIAEETFIRSEAVARRMGARLLALVAEGSKSRVYLSPVDSDSPRMSWATHSDIPTQRISDNPRWFSPPIYGLDTFEKLFTERQLEALTTFSDLVGEARERILQDARDAGAVEYLTRTSAPLADAQGYVDAVATYLAFAVSKAASRNCTLAIWEPGMGRLAGAFGRQAIPMQWSFAETNPLAGAGGDIAGTAVSVSEVLDRLAPTRAGIVSQADAAHANHRQGVVVATDPPYYDNIGYADLSDFFYVWLRRSLRTIYPTLLSTLLTPKAEELVATPHRFGGNKREAQQFFEKGLEQAFARMRAIQNESVPMTLFYAFKQSEVMRAEENLISESIASTGWETMLGGLIASGFSVLGTWPIRSEDTGSLKKDINALASSIVLVCRPRPAGAASTSRLQFLMELKRELPGALRVLQQGNVAPVDLAQAAIGPGMSIFSRYVRVLENDGSTMQVRTALALINQTLDEVLTEQEGEFDSDTRWALTWFNQYGSAEGSFDDANKLATARNTSVEGLSAAGVVVSSRGKVRLLKRDELPEGWDPTTDSRQTVWESTHHLIRCLEHGGEVAAARLLAKLGPAGQVARDLAYRLYTTCERKGWAQEAQAYNALVVAWPEIARQAASIAPAASAVEPEQASLSF